MISVFLLSLVLADPTADSVARSFSMIERQFVDLADAMPEDKWTFAPKDGAEGKYLRESFAYATQVLARMTSGNALDPSDGPYGGHHTRLGVSTLAVWHASDHYGQLVIYPRMNGIVPPASR